MESSVKAYGKDSAEDWCGNFQAHFCVVRGNGRYFHLDESGHKLYAESWDYTGDFREGSAVVHRGGSATHVDAEGNFLHGRWFRDLDVYHKGLARAKDSMVHRVLRGKGDGGNPSTPNLNLKPPKPRIKTQPTPPPSPSQKNNGSKEPTHPPLNSEETLYITSIALSHSKRTPRGGCTSTRRVLHSTSAASSWWSPSTMARRNRPCWGLGF